MTTKPRRFKGFAAFDGRGHLLWGTLSTTEARTRALFERYQPQVEDFETGGYIVEIQIFAKKI